MKRFAVQKRDSQNKSSPSMWPVYYKASGRWAPFGLLGFYAVMTFSALIMWLISHLFWAYFPDPRWLSVLMQFAWFGMTIIVVKYAVKAFKIRNPGMAFLIPLLGVATGWVIIWPLLWIMSSEPVRFIEAAKKPISIPPVLLMILGLYALVSSGVAKMRASHPFNEQGDRWFDKKNLPPIKFTGKNAHKTEKLLFKCKIDEFIQQDNYRQISNLSYFLSILTLHNAKL